MSKKEKKGTLIVACPTCKKSVNFYKSNFRPFCSKRCRILDTGDWAMEKHRIPGEKAYIGSGKDDNDDED